MKRTQLKRTSTLSRKPLCRGVKRLRRTRLKQVGKRREREEDALAEFREWDGEPCAECARLGEDHAAVYRVETGVYYAQPEAHHLVLRSQSAGHPLSHDLRLRVWLCRFHHDQVHRGELPQYIKPRSFLDTLLQEERTP